MTPAATRVVDAAGQRYGFSLSDDQRPWGCDHFAETGAMMPPEGLDRLRGSDAILVGAVGRPDVPDHVLLWTV